jgi:hypothetical protein
MMRERGLDVDHSTKLAGSDAQGQARFIASLLQIAT